MQTLAELGKQPKWEEVSRDIKEIVKIIDQDRFVRAVTTLNKISGMQLNEFELVKDTKLKTSIEDLGVSKYVTITENYMSTSENSENSPSKILQKKSI